MDAVKNAELYRHVNIRLAKVRENIAKAAQKAGRSEDAITLVTVTKKKPIEYLIAAYENGLRDFGENYAEEGLEKIEALKDLPDIRWHMIGHVQTKKAKIVAGNYDMVHSIDSVRIAEHLDNHCSASNPQLPVLIEVNLGGEASKYGFQAANIDYWPMLVEELNGFEQFANLRVCGLMTLPPFTTIAEDSRKYFVKIRALQEYLAAKLPAYGWNELSMGTSMDYGIAVEEGATMLRVGEAILGPRL